MSNFISTFCCPDPVSIALVPPATMAADLPSTMRGGLAELECTIDVPIWPLHILYNNIKIHTPTKSCNECRFDCYHATH